jgi:hypothetical protein
MEENNVYGIPFLGINKWNGHVPQTFETSLWFIEIYNH